jgi:preprotein translocase subunit SecE
MLHRHFMFGRCTSHAGDHYAGLHELQTTQLYDDQEQADDPRPHRDEEVLQVLQRAHASPRDEIGTGGIDVTFLARMKQGFGSTIAFFSDSWNELKKVRWPNRKELTSYSIVVFVAIIFVTIYFWVLDIIISELLELIV